MPDAPPQSTVRLTWLGEARRRGVLRVAASYGAIAWLLLQIVGTVSEPLDWPKWVMVALIWTAALGFPVACALAWFLEFTPQGVAVDQLPPTATRPATPGLRRYADVIIIGLLLVIVGYLVARQPGVTGVESHPTVAVLPFENVGGSSDGEVLALGIAESVLHQLSTLSQLDVISRTSSFAEKAAEGDARAIGERLQATYLLEGSVQSDRRRMRIITQLIDARTGRDVWSMRFDRRPSDIFSIQDEIALQVSKALQLVLDARSVGRLKGQGTEDLNAYLDYLQGRQLLASARVAEAREAIDHFRRATELDPKFAAAYVGLAEAGLFVAEFEVTGDRNARFRRALADGRELVDRALGLDPSQGDAYIIRAGIAAYSDPAAADADYRRGLELSPNSAKGYAGLAELLYESPERREEALELLLHARKLDPLQPRYGVEISVFQLYEQGDVTAAQATLLDVLRSSPDYQPALMRLAEIDRVMLGEVAAAIEIGERALELDPTSNEARSILVSAYLDLGYDAQAESVLDETEVDLPSRRLRILLHERRFREAGEAAYEAIEQGTIVPEERIIAVAAIRMHARVTKDFERARIALQSISTMRWGNDGKPRLSDRPDLRDVEIGIADILLELGLKDRGHALLQTLVDRLRYELDHDGRSELWYRISYPAAFALFDRDDLALGMLERSIRSHQALNLWWFTFDMEPAFATLRSKPAFRSMRAEVVEQVDAQRRKYERLRADGKVPDRKASAQPR